VTMNAQIAITHLLHDLPTAATSTFLALFPIVNPLGGVPLFFSLTADYTPEERHHTALKIAVDVIAILVVFMYLRVPDPGDRGAVGMERRSGLPRVIDETVDLLRSFQEFPSRTLVTLAVNDRHRFDSPDQRMRDDDSPAGSFPWIIITWPSWKTFVSRFFAPLLSI